MNMSTTKRYQDILQELSKTPREDVVKFRNKYEEALKLGVDMVNDGSGVDIITGNTVVIIA